MSTTMPATDLARHSRVIVDPDEMPYLVDRVEDRPDGTTRVTYSSGDVIDYPPGAEVSVR